MLRRSAKGQHPDSVRAVENFRKHGVPIGEEHFIQSEYTDGMSLIPWARSLNIAACLAQKADYIFIVDDDVWWRREDVAAAIKPQLPIVGFPVMLKTQDPKTRTLNYSVFPGEPWVDPDKEFRHVPRIGTGAMLVKAEVFHALQKRRPWFAAKGYNAMRPELPIQDHTYDYFPVGVRDIDGTQAYVGEDYGFCIEAASAGYPSFASGTSITAHMIAGETDGYLCDMRQVRALRASGKVTEGAAFAL